MQRLPLKQYAALLCETVGEYNFPPVTYDFTENKEICHGSIRDVEKCIHDLLCSGDTWKVKDGLSKVLYWGYANDPRWKSTKPKNFWEIPCAELEDGLKGFVQLARELAGSSIVPSAGYLLKIRDLGIPQFGRVSFASKILMFLNPVHYPVLDKKIATAYANSFSSPLQKLRFNPAKDTSIRITKDNAAVYDEWACWCHKIARVVNDSPQSPCNHFRVVDVERALFTLANSNKVSAIPTAHALLAGPED